MIASDSQKVASTNTIVDENPVIARMVTRQHLSAKEYSAANLAVTGSFEPGTYTAYDNPYGLSHCMDDETGLLATYDNGSLNAETPSYIISEIQNANPTWHVGYYENGSIMWGGTALATMPTNCPVLSNGTLVMASTRVEETAPAEEEIDPVILEIANKYIAAHQCFLDDSEALGFNVVMGNYISGNCLALHPTFAFMGTSTLLGDCNGMLYGCGLMTKEVSGIASGNEAAVVAAIAQLQPSWHVGRVSLNDPANPSDPVLNTSNGTTLDLLNHEYWTETTMGLSDGMVLIQVHRHQ